MRERGTERESARRFILPGTVATHGRTSDSQRCASANVFRVIVSGVDRAATATTPAEQLSSSSSLVAAAAHEGLRERERERERGRFEQSEEVGVHALSEIERDP